MADRPAAILFDLDDTILDDTGSVDSCWRDACALHRDGARLEPAVREVATDYWSDPDRHREGRADLLAASTTIVIQALAHIGTPDPELAAQIASRYRGLRLEAQRCLPGTVEKVRELRGRGILLGLLTNGGASSQRSKIQRFGLEPLFDYIGVEGELGYGKPDLRVYADALAGLGSDPAQTWMVGDNLEWDVLAPQRMGIRGWWVNPAGVPVPPGASRPYRTIRHVRDLP